MARFVRARHEPSCTRTVPPGASSSSATPCAPIIHSRPMVGVAKRVRVIDGIPTINVSAKPPIPTNNVIHEGRKFMLSTSRKRKREPALNDARPTPVQNRGTPTCTSTENASMAKRIAANANPFTGKTPRPKLPNTEQTAPTSPAIPIPAVKNSKMSSASPIVKKR